MIDMRKLYKPYAGTHTLEETLKWIYDEGAALKIDPHLVEAAVRETFLEMARGLEFDTDGSKLGFDGHPHAEMNLYLRARMIRLNELLAESQHKALEDSINKQIKQYMIQGRPRLFNWNKSPVIQLFKGNTRLTNWRKSPLVRMVKRGY